MNGHVSKLQFGSTTTHRTVCQLPTAQQPTAPKLYMTDDAAQARSPDASTTARTEADYWKAKPDALCLQAARQLLAKNSRLGGQHTQGRLSTWLLRRDLMAESRGRHQV